MSKRLSRQSVSKSKASPAKSPAPSETEQHAIARARARLAERSPRFRLGVKLADGKSKIDAPHSDHAGWADRFQDAFGTRGTSFAVAELNRLIRNSMTRDGELDHGRLDSLIAVVDGVQPANEVEAMIASQMAVTHSLAMDYLLRAKNAEHLSQFDSASRAAAKLLTAFGGHVELLNKLQRGGRQTVRVEHVHVHSGGQAIVGSVATGGRDDAKNERQPHAPEENQMRSARCRTP